MSKSIKQRVKVSPCVHRNMEKQSQVLRSPRGTAECALADVFPCTHTTVTCMSWKATWVFSFRLEILAKGPELGPIITETLRIVSSSFPNSLQPHRVNQTGPSTLTPPLHPPPRSTRSGPRKEKRESPKQWGASLGKGALAGTGVLGSSPQPHPHREGSVRTHHKERECQPACILSHRTA